MTLDNNCTCAFRGGSLMTDEGCCCDFHWTKTIWPNVVIRQKKKTSLYKKPRPSSCIMMQHACVPFIGRNNESESED